jgi:alanine racemase
MASPARLTVDLGALASNLAFLREAAGAAEVAPVVKADAYGLGLAPIARRLVAEGARTFFVARLTEGEALRASVGAGPTIYVFDGCPEGAAARLVKAALVPVLNSLPQVDAYAANAGRGAPAALHIDTGMNRLGLRPEEVRALVEAPGRLRGLNVDLVLSHLACAGDPTHPLNARQKARFEEVRALFPDARASLANSGGVFVAGAGYDLVRPGIALYGGGPQERPHPRVRAVATLEAEILQVRNVPPGESVGYGAAFTAERPMRVAILGAGYADGVRRASRPRGHVWFEGAPRAILGRVSMDLMAVDVTGCPDAQPGAWAEILGPNLLLDEAAAAADAIPYELLTGISPRVERIYRG